MSERPSSEESIAALDSRQISILLLSITFVALSGIVYELIIASISTYLLGNSVYQFSLTIGFFMFAMGIGSFLSRLVVKDLIKSFIVIEIMIAIVGGICSITMFQVFVRLNAMYVPVMYLFIITIGILVGLEVPILTRILSVKESIRKSLSDVLSLDYVGALIGSVAFPLLLLPVIGIIHSSFVIALINIFVALVNLWYFRPQLPVLKYLMGVSIFTFITLIVLNFFGSAISSYIEQGMFQDAIIAEKQSPYQRIVFTRSNLYGKHRLYIDGHIQFAESDEHRYHEALIHPLMSLPGKRDHVLILGGGDGLAVRELLKYPQIKTITLVDLDKAITDFAVEFEPLRKLNQKSLLDPKVTVINGDAFSFIWKSKKQFDRVVIDMPDPRNEALSKLYSREFYKLIRRRLSKDGALVTQSSSPFFARSVFWCVEKTLRSADYKTLSYKITVPAFGIWGFHLARRSELNVDELKVAVPTKYLTDQVIKAATVFGKDITRIETPINTLLEPKIYVLYNQDMAK